MSRKILVTGCAGFIGYHTTKALLHLGYTVVGLDNLNDYYDVNIKIERLSNLGIKAPYTGSVSIKYPEFIFEKVDICENEKLSEIFHTQSFDYVIHLAAQPGVRYSIENPRAYIAANINGFFNVIECCRLFNVSHFIYASSSSVYGDTSEQPFTTSQQVDEPVSLYAATKKSNELIAHSYSHIYKLKTTGLRFFTVYGPLGRPDMAPMIFLNKIFKKIPLEVYNNGNMLRDFTYISDIVDGIISVATQESFLLEEKKYAIFNIGNGNPINLSDFIASLEKQTKISASKNYLPFQLGDVKATWADTSVLKEKFGYTPKVNIEEGVNALVNWYRVFYKI